MLELRDVHASVGGVSILKEVSFRLEKGKVYALMGPNGSGKSTLANLVMGHPLYTLTKGSILFNGKDISTLSPDKRAQQGLFLSFQYPQEVAGVPLASFLRTAYNAIHSSPLSILEFRSHLEEKARLLKIPPHMLSRPLNEGFSGGEKKRAEILQMLVLNPSLAIMDETDSGLDIDALRVVSEGVNALHSPEKTILLITHYKRILHYIRPDEVLILRGGSIVLRGPPSLIDTLEEQGYEWIDKTNP